MNSTYAYKGHRFATMAERARAEHLDREQLAGAITELRFHPVVKLTAAELKFYPDYAYKRNGVQHFEDMRGEYNPRMKDMVKLWPVYGTGVLLLTRCGHRGVVVHQRVERVAQVADNDNAGNR